MRHLHGQLALSAGDLASHLACGHLTELDRGVAEGRLAAPAWRDPGLELLRERGFAHERAYVAHLRARGLQVVDLADVEGGSARERTRRALEAGAEVVVQAALERGRWGGRADLLIKVAGESGLGPWIYEVVDTKLAQETRGGTVLQLCLYADLLADLQGVPAPAMRVVKPGPGFPEERFLFAHYQAYYRSVQRRLEAAVAQGVDGEPTDVPDPVAHCEICRWWSRCDGRRREVDHLSLVAGMQSLHAGELRRQGLATLAAFAEAAEPLRERPQRGSRATFEGLQAQAAIQLRGRRSGRPELELLPFEPGRGLARLPEPSPGDVFLDFEGDPFVGAEQEGGGGLEYLLGYATAGADGQLAYQAAWALGRAEERRAFEAFVDVSSARFASHPGFHVYHYAPYEPAALKRLASRHATRERELDRLLRAERFVDLHAVTRQGLRASVESYSLKPLEAFFGYERAVHLRDEAAPALRRVARALELGVPGEITPEDRARVEGYNRDDCLSLVALRAWLEERRRELALGLGAPLERPPLRDGDESDGLQERGDEVQRVFEALVAGLPEEREAWTDEQRGRWLLAHLLEYFRRESRVAWWEFYARRDADDEALLDDRKALVGLELLEDLGGGRGTPTHRYRFPPQEASFDLQDDLRDARVEADAEHDADGIGSVAGIDLVRCTIDVKKKRKSVDRHPRVIHVLDHVTPKPLDGSLLDLARWIADHGLDAPDAQHRAARDLLLRLPPRRHDASTPLRRPREELVEALLRGVRGLDGGVLAVQGPPGSGKSWTGARVLLRLAREGSPAPRLGVCATSHKVIRSLLEKALEAAREAGQELRVTHHLGSRGKPDPANAPAGLTETTKPDDALAALHDGEIVGGTAWLWARPDAAGVLDHLFVDEAGQMSLAHVLAVARSARNLILLGDPQQLQQPQRGAHPEGAEVSALSHLLGEHRTIPQQLGLFLDRTWRLHPEICRYTSELFYDGRLEPVPELARQRLTSDTPFDGQGLFLVPCPHEGNQSSAPEEVDAVARIAGLLLAGGTSWTDRHGEAHPLREEDVLVIAPTNLQVAALSRRLPELRIGTVDKFQGQEAPVVLYSMTSSSAADAPRGMAFLYDPHRLDVATSRARVACILVASPRIFEPECRTPAQMLWANGLCRFRELARTVESLG